MNSIQLSYKTDVVVKKLKALNWIPETATGVYMIKDCILIQNYTGKTYTYKAINFISGENQYLFHRKNVLTNDNYNKIATKIMGLPLHYINHPKNGMEMIDFIFTELLPRYGYTIREEQVDLAKHMFNAMKNGKILMSDVAVGLGKTHAYLIAAIVYRALGAENTSISKMPIIISTSSIELQRAIIRDYIPSISKILYENGIITNPITCVLRKGKENYLCENRLMDYFKTIHPNKKRASEYKALEKLTRDKKIDLDEVKGISNYDKRKICVNSINCFYCKKYKNCSYQIFMRKARNKNFHFQICNHNYFLADIVRRKKGLVPLFPDYKTVIIDEGHKLLGAAQQIYGVVIKQNEINGLIKKMIPKNSKTKINKNNTRLCNEAINYNNLFFKELINNIPRDLFNEDTDKFNTIITPRANMLLKRVLIRFEELLKNNIYKDRKLLSDANRTIKDMKIFTQDNIIYWIEKPMAKGQCILSSIPKNLNKEMSNDLWCLDRSMILTSGTISVDDDFNYIKKKLGLDNTNKREILEISKSSPFNYKENCLIYIANNIPYPNNNDEYINKVTEETYKLIKASNGHALVLFTSYKPLRKVFKNLSEKIKDIPFIEMGRGRNDIILKFKNSEKGVLFATGSMWEGINIPGDILSHLIIVKLPFPIPDPISEYEKILYDDVKEYKNLELIPKMLIKLRQGVGRLIRSETDTGVISILDVRASSKGKYHKTVIQALPNCKITHNIEDIKTFIQDKKDPEYFLSLDNH